MEPENANERWKSPELRNALLGSIDKLGGSAKQTAIIKCSVENYKISMSRNTFHLAVGALIDEKILKKNERTAVYSRVGAGKEKEASAKKKNEKEESASQSESASADNDSDRPQQPQPQVRDAPNALHANANPIPTRVIPLDNFDARIKQVLLLSIDKLGTGAKQQALISHCREDHAVGMDRGTFNNYMGQLIEAGLVTKLKAGVYARVG